MPDSAEKALRAARPRRNASLGARLLAKVSALKSLLASGDTDLNPAGSGDIRAVLHSARSSFIAAAVFSGAINILALSGSIFMLQVYDRVLPSRSLATLQALLLLVVLLYLFVGGLEWIRSRLFARIGRHVDQHLRAAVFTLNTYSGLPGHAARTSSAFADLGQIRTFLASGGPSAIFDLPWMPLYAILLFLLHPWLGVLGLFGIALLAGLTWLSDRTTRTYQTFTQKVMTEANDLAEASRRAAETVIPMGMNAPLMAHWGEKHTLSGDALVRNADSLNLFASLSRFWRMLLQSLVLAVGAWLVIRGEATGGVMIAGSIILGRALAPVEQAIGQWRGFVAARQAYGRLAQSLHATPTAPETRLPAPTRSLAVDGLYATAPSDTTQVLLTNIQFELQAGDALGVIGPSGAGKSTLARVLLGVWPAARGSVRLDGSTLTQWSAEDRGAFCGYLPQTVELFEGTIGQNIARFQPHTTSEAILAAAELAGVDSFVRNLSQGFDTDIGPGGGRLSAGQRQRLALARAVFGKPFFVVLDEPNSALDAEGEAALISTIAKVRERGGIVIVFAHRPHVLQSVNKVLALGDGTQKAFGPRDEILKRLIPVKSTPAARPATDAAPDASPQGGRV